MALLKEFRLMNASALRQPNRIIYPPTLRLLPLWTLGTIRSAAFRWVLGLEASEGQEPMALVYPSAAPAAAVAAAHPILKPEPRP